MATKPTCSFFCSSYKHLGLAASLNIPCLCWAPGLRSVWFLERSTRNEDDWTYLVGSCFLILGQKHTSSTFLPVKLI